MDVAYFKDKLRKYLPEAALDYVAELLFKEPIQLKITQDRVSKLGDYRPPYRGNGHRISVNGSLNKYAFLLTLIHEFAHYKAQIAFGNNHKPHGSAWKEIFKKELNPLLNTSVFPEELFTVLSKHMQNPKASSASDPALREAFKRYDKHQTTVLSDLPEGAIFRLRNSRIFQRGKKLRTRYHCVELTTKREFRVHAMAEVELIKT